MRRTRNGKRSLNTAGGRGVPRQILFHRSSDLPNALAALIKNDLQGKARFAKNSTTAARWHFERAPVQ